MINHMGKAINENARNKGFYPEGQNHSDPVWISNRLMLITSELAEALEAIRQDPPNMSSQPKTGGFGEELADACIRIFDLATSLDIDLEAAILAKMEFNLTRPQKHGGRRI